MSKTVHKVDKIIDLVEAVQVSQQASSGAHGSTATRHGNDVAWHPVIPRGHTRYSWTGHESAHAPSESKQAAKSPAKAAAKSPAKKSPAKSPSKAAAPAKKSPAKAAAPAKSPVKKSPTKAASPAKKSPAKAAAAPAKSPAKKSPAKAAAAPAKSPAKKSPTKAAAAPAKKSPTKHTSNDASSEHKSPAKPAPKKKGGAQTSDPNQPPFSRLDIRVGRIVTAQLHPNADSLYLEQIDVGEDEPRQVISGLVKYVPLDEFVGSQVLVICNLKPAKMRGEMSYGMVLAASNADHSEVELVRPNPKSAPGDKVFLDDGNDYSKFKPDDQINPTKKNNSWLAVKDLLKTDSHGVAQCDGKPIVNTHGHCTVKRILNGTIS